LGIDTTIGNGVSRQRRGTEKKKKKEGGEKGVREPDLEAFRE